MTSTSSQENLNLFVSDQELEYNAKSMDVKKRTIEAALFLLEQDMVKPESFIINPSDIKNYARLKLGGLPYEVFGVFFLDQCLGVIAYEAMFRGTLSQTSVYPREVVIRALQLNASAVVFTHNHPSGNAMPSHADECLTQTLKHALKLVDVRVLDHIIVTGQSTVSFAETGLL